MVRTFRFTKDESNNEVVQIAARGREVLSTPIINQGTAFTSEERIALGIDGLLPSGVTSLSDQLARVYRQYQTESSDLAKYIYLLTMQDRNETLFYKLLSEHIKEMLPIVYTPTIGQAIQEYSHWFHRPRGVYLSIDHPEQIESSLRAFGRESDEVDLIVATDSEGILGIGDQGVGGVAITVGKISVYVAAGGIHPYRAIPVVLDTGTDNLELLNDPGYLGVRHARVRGQRYDEFIQQYVETAHRLFPHALLHWEDFGASNAHRILDRYTNDYCTFNDDIQGTAAVVVAAAMSAIQSSQSSIADQRIVIHGAGTAGAGIAELLIDVMAQRGISREEAVSKFWCLGSRGLLVEGNPMRDFQQPFARPISEVKQWLTDEPGRYSLADVVRNVQPTMLIGTSAQPGCFTEPIIRDMAAHCERPIIMPLSNPTSKAEALPADLIEWTDGRALIATGSPFDNVHHRGVTHRIAQANNALVFPGIGLGVATSAATRVTNGMMIAAAKAVADSVSDRSLGACLLPSINALRPVSARVGLAVAEQAVLENVASRTLVNPVQEVYDKMWTPNYPKVEIVDVADINDEIVRQPVSETK